MMKRKYIDKVMETPTPYVSHHYPKAQILHFSSHLGVRHFRLLIFESNSRESKKI
jgi:hypothetical protein